MSARRASHIRPTTVVRLKLAPPFNRARSPHQGPRFCFQNGNGGSLSAVSWSLSTKAHPAPEIRDAIDHIEPQDHVSDAQLSQIREAKEKAKGIVNSGVLGDATILATDDPVFLKAKLSGHAGTTPGPGDKVSVEIERVADPS